MSAGARLTTERAQARARRDEREKQGWAKQQPLTANVLTPFGQQRELTSPKATSRRERRQADSERRAGARKPMPPAARGRVWKNKNGRTVAARKTHGRTKQKRIARAKAERTGRAVALREAREVYLLIYRARGRTGPYPLSTPWSPGLLGWVERGVEPMPVVGR